MKRVVGISLLLGTFLFLSSAALAAPELQMLTAEGNASGDKIALTEVTCRNSSLVAKDDSGKVSLTIDLGAFATTGVVTLDDGTTIWGMAQNAKPVPQCDLTLAATASGTGFALRCKNMKVQGDDVARLKSFEVKEPILCPPTR